MMVKHATPTPLPEIAGARTLVYSLGIEGRDLARCEADRANGASVTMADTRTAAQLEAAGATPPEGVERTIRGELLDPEGFDLLAVSQSVLRTSPNVMRARELGIPVISQMALALRLCRGRIVGITGSSGKSTTTALVGAMAESAGAEHLVGGNLGGSLLDRIEAVPETASVILEVSHTQLQYTDRSPAIAAITNVTPNHLDQFSWPEYVDLKRRILGHQDADGLAILERRRRDEPRAARGRAAGAWPRSRWRDRSVATAPGSTVTATRLALGWRQRTCRERRRSAHARSPQRRERRPRGRHRAGDGPPLKRHRGGAAALPRASPPPTGGGTRARGQSGSTTASRPRRNAPSRPWRP